MITWKDTINLIEKMFEISQKELAEILGVPESTISKIKNGKQASVFNREDIFKKVFSSEAKGNLANNKKYTENQRLDVLKGIIEEDFPSIKEAMEDVWEKDNYQEFTMTLLDLTRSSSNNEPKTCITTKNKEKFLKDDPIGKIYKIFQDRAEKYEIEEFMDINTTIRIHDKWNEQPVSFHNEIEKEIIDPFKKDIVSDPESNYGRIVLKMEEFNDVLDAYMGYLGLNMVSAMEYCKTIEEMETVKDYLQPISHNPDYSNQVYEYRMSLKSLWEEINNNVKEEFVRFSKGR